MAPYTAEGIQERERNDNSGMTETMSTSAAATKNRNSLTLTNPRLSPNNYELVGVVVHSGQASAGHYYSFIKDRKRGGSGSTSSMDGSSKSRWFKFNDTSVEEFEMTDSTLEAECFGGTYKAKSYDSSNEPPPPPPPPPPLLKIQKIHHRNSSVETRNWLRRNQRFATRLLANGWFLTRYFPVSSELFWWWIQIIMKLFITCSLLKDL